jgi:predicted lipid-binding transport protein (Tim44 family)
VDESPHTLMAAGLVAGLVVAGLLLPSALMDLAFGTDFLSILSQAVLAAFAVALIIGVWSAQKQK